MCNVKLNVDELNSLLILIFALSAKFAMPMHVRQTVLAFTSFSLSLSLWGLLGLRYSDAVHEWAL